MSDPSTSAHFDPFPGEFRLESELGRGTFGIVWLARDLSPLGRYVALKFVRGTSERGARALDLLRREAGLLASFSHPHIVQVHAWRQPLGEDFPCLVLQYVAGGSLRQRVERDGPLRWDVATRYMTDIAEGLAAMHAHGVVHRDVKPDNLLHDPKADEALLTDLGVAARLTDPASEGGTPYFMAPEGFDGVLSPALDVYSLAASLFWLITGKYPFDGDSRAGLRRAIEGGLPSVDPRFANVPATLEGHIRAGLRAGDERPGLDAFARALRASLNLLMADRLAPIMSSPANLRLLLYRVTPSGTVLLGATMAETEPLGPEPGTIPARPDRVTLHTGDRVRVSVVADRPGHVVVFNVGPTGRLNLILPTMTTDGRPIPPVEVELTPPAGRERLVALWTRDPLPIEDRGEKDATRAMGRVEEALGQLPAEAREAVVLELDHRGQ